MKKKALVFLFAASMMFGSAALLISSNVRADEPVYSDEQNDEEKSYEDSQYDLASPNEPKKRGVSINNLIDDQAIDQEDSADSSWLDDYEYSPGEDGEIVLYDYIGSKTDVYVPQTVTKLGKTYQIRLGQSSDGSIWAGNLSGENYGVNSITLEKGVLFPSNSTYLFANCSDLKSISMEGVKTDNVKIMEGMFRNCYDLEKLDLSSFDTENVTVMSGMFLNCYSLKDINLSSFTTDNLKTADCMFGNCRSLKELNLSNFNLINLSFGINSYPDDFLGKCDSLEVLYTPIQLQHDIHMPCEMFDQEGKLIEYLPVANKNTKKLVKNFTGWTKGSINWYFLKNNETFYTDACILGYGYINGTKGWYTAYNSQWNKEFTGLCKFYGKNGWGFARNGKYDTSYSGLALATNGHWYYVNKGKLDKSFDGKLASTPEGKWYYVRKGSPTTNFSGKIAETTNGKWYYCTNGRPDLKFSGKIAYATNGSWYYVTKGRIDRSFTGIAQATNGKYYYVVKGKLDKTYTGKVTYNGKTYNIVKGAVH